MPKAFLLEFCRDVVAVVARRARARRCRVDV